MTAPRPSGASFLARLFARDYARYEGVRPINVLVLRIFYFLMAAFVGTEAWGTLLGHEGPWENTRAVAWCVWAAYPTLSLLGLVHPLRMLPLMLFMLFYKALWLAVVAYPLWRAGTLATSPANEMAHVYMLIVVPALAVPWGYVWRTFVLPGRRTQGDV